MDGHVAQNALPPVCPAIDVTIMPMVVFSEEE